MLQHTPPAPTHPEARLAQRLADLGQQLQQLQQARQGGVVSWGRVGPAGEIAAGTGDFTAEHLGTGSYKVKWKAEKGTPLYAITFTPVAGGALSFAIGEITAAYATCGFANAGAATDTGFTFIAMSAA